MTLDWQDLLTLGLIVAALAYVVRRLRRLLGGRQQTGCGTCSNCPASGRRNELISIRPPASMMPERNSIDERCPSPMARRLKTKRCSPGASPSWLGAGTIEGLVSAADSIEYSWVK